MTAEDAPELRGTDVLNVVAALAAFTILAVTFLFFALAVIAVLGFRNVEHVPGPIFFAIEVLVIWLTLHLVLVQRRGISWIALGWVPISWGWLALATAACAAIYAVTISIQLMLTWVGSIEAVRWLPTEVLPLFPQSLAGLILSLALGGVLVPIAEEFLFRGVLYRWMRYRWDASIATVGSAAIFALAHPMGAGSSLQIFVVGLLLAWMFEQSGSLWPSMVLHGCNNSIGIIWIYTLIWSEVV